MPDKAELTRFLEEHGQPHLLTFWDELNAAQRDQLSADIARIDFEQFAGLMAAFQTGKDDGADESVDGPGVPVSFPATPSHALADQYRRANELGIELIRASRVAAMVVAGGQATRLGIDGPKGAFPIGPVSGNSLFQIFAESILATNRRWGCGVAWYVMTSDANHDETVRFFRDHGYFGLSAADVAFFQQGMFPIADTSGRILLDEKHRVAMAPNGHGGSLTALAETGMLDDMRRRGVEHVSYFQVDNPLVRPIDPLFVGLHALEKSQASSLTVRKASDDEKVGVFVTAGGRLRVLEYTSMPEAMARRRTANGERLCDLANIAVHVFERLFLESLVAQGAVNRLPWHRAVKKVPYIDTTTGRRVEPAEPNAVKCEMFVFDALPRAERTMLLEADRAEVFSPVKNAAGVDSVATAQRDMIARAARWLERCGVNVPRDGQGQPDCAVEISPLAAMDSEELANLPSCPLQLDRGTKVHLL